MFRQNWISIIIALAIAVGVTYSIFIMIQKPPSTDPELDKVLRVLVTTKKLRMGDTLKADHLEWREWPFKLVTNEFMIEGARKPQDLSGVMLRNNVGKGEPIKQNFLVTHKEGGYLSKLLKEGRRAISVPVNAVTGVSGFILPGDRVDLVLTHAVSDKPDTSKRNRSKRGGAKGSAKTVTEVIMAYVKVLAVDTTPDVTEKTKAKKAKTITIEVTPRQANIIAYAQRMGTISMTLRRIDTDDKGVDASVVEGTFFKEKLQEAEPTERNENDEGPKVKAPPPPQPVKDVITIIRGTEVETYEYDVNQPLTVPATAPKAIPQVLPLPGYVPDANPGMMPGSVPELPETEKSKKQSQANPIARPLQVSPSQQTIRVQGKEQQYLLTEPEKQIKQAEEKEKGKK